MDRKTLKITIIAAAIFSVTAYASLGRSGRIERVEASTVIETNTASADDPIKARAAFNEAVKVFFSARCSNCHPAGDGPTQGDEHRIHDQDVKRGTDGKGVAGMECATCHQVPKEHSANPRGFSVGKPKENTTCEACHASKGAQQAGSPIPQVAPEHSGRYLCWDCHYPHFPEGKK